MSADSKPEIKAEVTELAKELKKVITIDPKTGLGTIEEGTYIKHLPEGITEATLKTINKHNQVFAAGAGMAFGELSVPVLAKNDELARTTLTVGTSGHDSFDFDFLRSKLTGKPGEEKTEKFGHLKVGMTIRATGNVGQLSRVKAHLSQLAATKLKK